ncbi:hypothetical protein KSP35_13705 [Aquihabitans sp. G128]|uniref:hypothetical protein n=1 Tax=Aquihabitans sp. G128 TaxID=2849779 RepID=UPI001C24EE28|nr:hypothetical protein [Aquihabitans sp. G128]QXC59454.1 hypothetical protein KSP35_13705 [Aquihabitans sp. G128]
MATIVGFLGSVTTSVVELAGLPARHLASFMDDVDEVWLDDAFLDQPDRTDAGW